MVNEACAPKTGEYHCALEPVRLPTQVPCKAGAIWSHEYVSRSPSGSLAVTENVPVFPATSAAGPEMLAATVGGWFTFWTVMSRVPCTLPPCPSETVTRR